MLYENLKKKSKINKIRLTELTIFIIVFLIISVPYFWLKNTSDEISIRILNYLFTRNTHVIETLKEIGHISTAVTIHLAITMLIFNFSNIFKIIILNILFFSSSGLSAVMQLIYLKPMLFIINNYEINESNSLFIEPYDCNFGYVSPTASSIHITSIILSIWWMFVPDGRYSRMYKSLTFTFCILIILFLNICLFLHGHTSINDLVFSTFLGIMCFSFIFCVLKIDVNKSKDIKLIMNNKLLILLINFIVTAVTLVLFFTNERNEKIDFMISCTNCYFDFPGYRNPALNSLICLGVFLSNSGMFLGVHLEQMSLTNNDENKFGFFNFEGDKNDLESIYTFSDALKSAQWNDTGIGKTLIRLAISTVFLLVTIGCVIFVPHLDSQWFIIVILFKYIFPLFFYNFSVFYLQKLIFIKWNLVNKNAINDNSKVNTSRHNSLSSEQFDK